MNATDHVIVERGNHPRFNSHKDSYLVFTESSIQKVARVGDLTDEQLLLAIANSIELKSTV